MRASMGLVLTNHVFGYFACRLPFFGIPENCRFGGFWGNSPRPWDDYKLDRLFVFAVDCGIINKPSFSVCVDLSVLRPPYWHWKRRANVFLC